MALTTYTGELYASSMCLIPFIQQSLITITTQEKKKKEQTNGGEHYKKNKNIASNGQFFTNVQSEIL